MAYSEFPLLLATLVSLSLELSPQERLRIVILTTFGIVWFFWLGAALGSYLNVVAYRMPLKLASVAPDSRCPKCKTPIRWYDNIPIVSWLALGGKCRACHEPISPRYLIVEAVMGSLFVLLLAVEVLTGGANLPVRESRGYSGMPILEHFMQRDLVGIFAYHALLIWFVSGLVLFAIDGHRVPRSYAIAALVLVLVPPIFWPELRPVPFWQRAAGVGLRNGFAEAIAGLGAGATCGCLLALAIGKRDRRKTMATMSLLGAVVGGALGWHAALVWFTLCACAWMLHLLVCLSAGGRVPLPLAVVAAAGLLALLVGWSGFFEWYPQPITRMKYPAIPYLMIAAVLSVLPVAVGRYLEERLSAARPKIALPQQAS
jgi:leader peptidase (prepilin peptidase)/N-methyltransferase